MSNTSIQKKAAGVALFAVQLYTAFHLDTKWIYWTFFIGTNCLLIGFIISALIPGGNEETAKTYIKPNAHFPIWLDILCYGSMFYGLYYSHAYGLMVSWFGIATMDASARYSSKCMLRGTPVTDPQITRFFAHWPIIKTHLEPQEDFPVCLALNQDWGIKTVEEFTMDNGQPFAIFQIFFRKTQLMELKQVGDTISSDSVKLDLLKTDLHPVLESTLVHAGVQPLPKPTDPFDL
jgi:hypothetical protein